MSTIVSLDLETTGVDPQKDHIIEIGAVKFNERRIEGEWSTLVNPGVKIPSFITQLTGISTQMVANAPRLDDILDTLDDFASVAPILGHNVKFDLSFLRKHNIFLHSEELDTYDMAAVLLPRAGRYNLGILAQILGIPAPTQHRALADAYLTQGVYVRLLDIAKELPISVISEIVRLCQNIEWGGYHIFRQVLDDLEINQVDSHNKNIFTGPIFQLPPPVLADPLSPNEDIIDIDIEKSTSFLDHGGAFSKLNPNFESRNEQIQLCRNIGKAINSGIHLLAEAGTGIGKSLAYLIPAALWSTSNNLRVVISTNTINLQDQLINKDIPDICHFIEDNLHSSVIKGRNNYLCPRKFNTLRKKGPETPDEMRILAKIIIWLLETETGDLNEINITGPIERSIWNRISAADEGCTANICAQRMGGICPFYRAKHAAQQSHLLIVNHALLLADVASGNRVLPDYDYLIIDEAHHLESAITEALSFRVSQSNFDRTIRELGSSKSGILGYALQIFKDILDPGNISLLTQLIQQISDQSFHIQNLVNRFYTGIDRFLLDQREGRPLGNYPQHVRITSSIRHLASWEEVEILWEETSKSAERLSASIESILQLLSEFIDCGQEDIEDLMTNVSSIYRRLSDYHQNINGLVFEPKDNIVYWIENNPHRHTLTLEGAPLYVGDLIEEKLWHAKKSVVMTSATLASKGDFSYIRSRLNAVDAEELCLGSPFDYKSSTLLYIPDDVPEPNERIPFQKSIERGLISLCTSTHGRTLALFTSYNQLQKTSNSISGPLSDKGIITYEQGQGASPHALLESFKSADQAILLGTRAFWEGVDVPGDSLSVLAIIRLPFSVPTDPIVSARSETFDQPFYEYSIPEAILTFRQGFGRLIRSHQDRGVVVIFDKRVLTKQYGQLFFDSLPQCTVETGRLEDLPSSASRWLGL